VNVAARLQDMTKTLICEVIVSEDVCVTAGIDSEDVPSAQQVAIRGRLAPIVVFAMNDARVLTALIEDAEKAIA